MRVWNIVDQEERKRPFEPVAAEVFCVQGKTKSRLFSTIMPVQTILDSDAACEYCNFKREEDKLPLCKILPIVCNPANRSDKRQVIFIEREPAS